MTETSLDDLIHAGTKTYEQVDALFATLPPVTIEALIGTWRAAYIPRVSGYQRVIDMGWYGMRFTDENTVDTMLIVDGSDVFAADVIKLAGAMTAETRHMSELRSEIETHEPTCCLRMIEHRGALSAAAIYDRQPVIDYFRLIDDNAVVCAAEGRGRTEVAYSVLQRVGRP